VKDERRSDAPSRRAPADGESDCRDEREGMPTYGDRPRLVGDGVETRKDLFWCGHEVLVQ
jgi:hypothetical protein